MTATLESEDDAHRATYRIETNPKPSEYASYEPGQRATSDVEYSTLGSFYYTSLLATQPAAPGQRAGFHQPVHHSPKVSWLVDGR